nr:hypothetical protein [Aureimonas sp. D3]
MSRAVAPLKTGAPIFTDDKQLKDLSARLVSVFERITKRTANAMTVAEMTAEPTCENVPDNLIRPLLALSKSTRQLISLKLAEIGVVAGRISFWTRSIPTNDAAFARSRASFPFGLRPFRKCWTVWSGGAGAGARWTTPISGEPSWF